MCRTSPAEKPNASICRIAVSSSRSLMLSSVRIARVMRGCGFSVGMVDIAQAVAGVEEHQPVRVGLDQQAMADQMPVHALAAPVEQRAADRTVGAAIEVVNTHGCSPG